MLEQAKALRINLAALAIPAMDGPLQRVKEDQAAYDRAAAASKGE